MSFAFALVLDPPCRRSPKPRRPASTVAPIFILCCAQIPHKPQQPADHASASQPSLPSIASPTPHLLHRCGQIPIVPAPPPSAPHRGFVLWRLSDAGRRSLSHPRQRPASETLHIKWAPMMSAATAAFADSRHECPRRLRQPGAHSLSAPGATKGAPALTARLRGALARRCGI